MGIISEVAKRAIQGWHEFLVAHLGQAGATLVWTVIWVYAALLGAVYGRYWLVLGYRGERKGSAERQVYDSLLSVLRQGGSPTRLYAKLLKRLLDAVDKFLGDADVSSPRLFGLRNSYPLWTAPALDRCLMLALLYPIFTFFAVWQVSGDPRLMQEIFGIAQNLPDWRRVFSGLAVVFGLFVFWHYEIFTSDGAVMIALVGPCIVDSLATASIGPFMVVSGLTSMALAVIIAGVMVKLRKVTIDHQITFMSLFFLTMFLTCFGAAHFLSSAKHWETGTGPIMLFLMLFPLLNAPFDWASLGLTRALLRRGLELQGWWPYVLGFVDLILALVILVLLAGAMIVGVQAFDLAATLGGGKAILPIGPLLDKIEADPSEPANWWAYGLLISTLIPSIANLLIGAVSLTRGVPGVSRCLRGALRTIPIGTAVPISERMWMALVLTGQWAVGTLLTIGAFLALGLLMAEELPQIGMWFLDLARWVAALDLPAKTWAVIQSWLYVSQNLRS